MNDPSFQFSKDPFSKTQTNNSCCNKCNDQEFVQFRPNSHVETDDSGSCSPPLWKKSPQPLVSRHVYRSLSPNGRVQAIVRGQKELMEMVKNMPESSYELSLKDLVELSESRKTPFDSEERVVVKVKRQESRKSEKNSVRNWSFEMEGKGVFLKTAFPFSLPPNRKKKVDGSLSGRVRSKSYGGEGDWWKKKKKSSGWSDSDTSNNSGGGGRSYGGGRENDSLVTGCWPFSISKNTKNVE